MQVNIERVLSKRVSELTGEDKRVLREWLRSVRSPTSYDIDLHRRGKRVPVFVRTWARHPERYDIPGVDTPSSSTTVQKRPRYVKLEEFSYTKKPRSMEVRNKIMVEQGEEMVEPSREHGDEYDDLAWYLWESIPRRLRSGRRRKWSYVQARALAKYIYNRAKEYGFDPYQYDWAHIIDWEQGYGHAKETVDKYLSVHGGIEHSMEHGGKYMGYDDELEQEIERSYRELGEIGRRLVEEPYMLDPATKWELEHPLY